MVQEENPPPTRLDYTFNVSKRAPRLRRMLREVTNNQANIFEKAAAVALTIGMVSTLTVQMFWGTDNEFVHAATIHDPEIQPQLLWTLWQAASQEAVGEKKRPRRQQKTKPRIITVPPGGSTSCMTRSNIFKHRVQLLRQFLSGGKASLIKLIVAVLKRAGLPFPVTPLNFKTTAGNLKETLL